MVLSWLANGTQKLCTGCWLWMYSFECVLIFMLISSCIWIVQIKHENTDANWNPKMRKYLEENHWMDFDIKKKQTLTIVLLSPNTNNWFYFHGIWNGQIRQMTSLSVDRWELWQSLLRELRHWNQWYLPWWPGLHLGSVQHLQNTSIL